MKNKKHQRNNMMKEIIDKENRNCCLTNVLYIYTEKSEYDLNSMYVMAYVKIQIHIVVDQ